MKALEIIKQWDNIKFGDSLEQHKRKIDEAIKELEELNNRSCEGCKYETEKDCKGNFITVCSRHPRLTDRYEAKGE